MTQYVMNIFDTYENDPVIRKIMKLVIITFLCLMVGNAIAQDTIKKITSKHFEEPVMPGEVFKTKHPAVLMDLDRGTMYYMKSSRYDELVRVQPELEREFQNLQDSLMKVYQEADSLSLIFAQRDSTGTMAFEQCETSRDAAIQTAIERGKKYISEKKKNKIYKKLLIVSVGLDIILFLIIIISINR